MWGSCSKTAKSPPLHIPQPPRNFHLGERIPAVVDKERKTEATVPQREREKERGPHGILLQDACGAKTMKLVVLLCCVTATLWQAESFPAGEKAAEYALL